MKAYKVYTKMEEGRYSDGYEFLVFAENFIDAAIKADEQMREVEKHVASKNGLPRINRVEEECEIVGDIGVARTPEEKNAWAKKLATKVKSHQAEE